MAAIIAIEAIVKEIGSEDVATLREGRPGPDESMGCRAGTWGGEVPTDQRLCEEASQGQG